MDKNTEIVLHVYCPEKNYGYEHPLLLMFFLFLLFLAFFLNGFCRLLFKVFFGVS
jgi:hypothetical protein